MENNNFEGIKFTEEQIRKIRQIAEETINYCDGGYLEFIFDFVFNEQNKLIVCPENRVTNYINTLYRLLYKNKNKNMGKNFFTASNYLAHIPMICIQYMKTGKFPPTNFFEDIIWYGYDINELYNDTLKAIHEYLSIMNSDKYINSHTNVTLGYDINNLYDSTLKTVEKYISEMNEDFHINLGFKNSLLVSACSYLYVDSKYSRCKQEKFCFNYDNLSMQISWPLTSTGATDYLFKIAHLLGDTRIFSTTNIALSLYEKNENDDIHTEFARAALKCNFIKCENGSPNEEIYVRPLKDNNGNIFAFYTLTLYQNKVDNRFSVTPYIIMSDFKYEKGSISLFDNYREEYSNMKFLNRNKAEALYLILNYNLLLLISKECNKNLIESDRLDIDRIRLNFQNKMDENEDLVGDLIKYKEPIWTFEEMDKFILNSTKNSTPLFSKLDTNNRKNYDAISDMLIDIIIEETHRIDKRVSSILNGEAELNTSVTDIKTYSINTILDKARKLGINSEIDAINFIGKFLEYTNKGDIDTKLNRDKDTYQYTYRMG